MAFQPTLFKLLLWTFYNAGRYRRLAFAIINNIYLLTTAISRLVVVAHMTGSGSIYTPGFNESDPIAVAKAIQDDLDFNYQYLVGRCLLHRLLAGLPSRLQAARAALQPCS